MKTTLRLASYLAVFMLCAGLLSCKKKEGSSATGWSYNDPEWGGFYKAKDQGQKTGPGLTFVEGGTFVMGAAQQDVMYEYDNVPRRVTVSSFYMDENEVTNINYREYTYWLKRVFGETYPEVVRKAQPDTLVWREELAYNEPYVKYYFRHPSFNDYPVVGVTWLQANEYCRWRSDRVNEKMLVDEGILELDPNQQGEDNFNSEAYLAGQYEGVVKKGMKNYDPNGEETRRVRFDDGIMLPDYRLPTEAEWEYAALAQMGTQPTKDEERYMEKRIYPWDGYTVRSQRRGKYQGAMLANFKRGRGDNMGVAGALNDNAEITAPVKTYMPNDFGLYNMAGNVSEWCLDVYRPMSSSDVEDFNPFRGNVFTTLELDEEGKAAPKDSLGRLKYREYEADEIGDRYNYQQSNVVDYRDGDDRSQVEYDDNVTLVNDKSRVVKGGSWNDRAYYLSPSVRRYMDEDQAANWVGFRCAMMRVGPANGETLTQSKKGRFVNQKK